MIDDDINVCKQIKELFDGETINGNTLSLEYRHSFEDGIIFLKENACDLLILDLFKGKPSDENSDRPGEQILEHIKATQFIPIIFFSGLIKPIEHLKTEIIRVVRKGDGNDALKSEISSVLSSQLPLISKKIHSFVTEAMRSYFWDFIHENWNSFKDIKDEMSLGFLLMRRLANLLSKDEIAKLLNDPKIKTDKAHPMEFYIYPSASKEYETGDILKKDSLYYILLTPSCDMIDRGSSGRKAQQVILVQFSLLENTPEFIAYKANRTPGNKNSLELLIKGRRGDRYFFLPGTPFIENSVLDFQNVINTSYSDLSTFEKIAKLDDPYGQSALSSFIRYYNRIGHDDIDCDYVMHNIDNKLL
jgi:hypothetical protein